MRRCFDDGARPLDKSFNAAFVDSDDVGSLCHHRQWPHRNIDVRVVVVVVDRSEGKKSALEQIDN